MARIIDTKQRTIISQDTVKYTATAQYWTAKDNSAHKPIFWNVVRSRRFSFCYNNLTEEQADQAIEELKAEYDRMYDNWKVGEYGDNSDGIAVFQDQDYGTGSQYTKKEVVGSSGTRSWTTTANIAETDIRVSLDEIKTEEDAAEFWGRDNRAITITDCHWDSKFDSIEGEVRIDGFKFTDEQLIYLQGFEVQVWVDNGGEDYGWRTITSVLMHPKRLPAGDAVTAEFGPASGLLFPVTDNCSVRVIFNKEEGGVIESDKFMTLDVKTPKMKVSYAVAEVVHGPYSDRVNLKIYVEMDNPSEIKSIGLVIPADADTRGGTYDGPGWWYVVARLADRNIRVSSSSIYGGTSEILSQVDEHTACITMNNIHAAGYLAPSLAGITGVTLYTAGTEVGTKEGYHFFNFANFFKTIKVSVVRDKYHEIAFRFWCKTGFPDTVKLYKDVKLTSSFNVMTSYYNDTGEYPDERGALTSVQSDMTSLSFDTVTDKTDSVVFFDIPIKYQPQQFFTPWFFGLPPGSPEYYASGWFYRRGQMGAPYIWQLTNVVSFNFKLNDDSPARSVNLGKNEGCLTISSPQGKIETGDLHEYLLFDHIGIRFNDVEEGPGEKVVVRFTIDEAFNKDFTAEPTGAAFIWNTEPGDDGMPPSNGWQEAPDSYVVFEGESGPQMIDLRHNYNEEPLVYRLSVYNEKVKKVCRYEPPSIPPICYDWTFSVLRLFSEPIPLFGGKYLKTGTCFTCNGIMVTDFIHEGFDQFDPEKLAVIVKPKNEDPVELDKTTYYDVNDSYVAVQDPGYEIEKVCLLYKDNGSEGESDVVLVYSNSCGVIAK